MIIYNAKKRPNSVFLKFSFLFWPVLLLIVFFFFFSPDKGNSIKADFDSFNPVTNVGGDAVRAILDTFAGLGGDWGAVYRYGIWCGRKPFWLGVGLYDQRAVSGGRPGLIDEAKC
jgi:hypothetical protein